MASQIVMDRTGDTRHIFNNEDRAEVAKAEQRFMELTGAGIKSSSISLLAISVRTTGVTPTLRFVRLSQPGASLYKS